MNSYIIKVNGDYYAGEHEDTTPTPRYTDGWYSERGESNVIFFMKERSQAKICEGLINLNSSWQRIYNSMRYDGLKVKTIEIEKISEDAK